MYSTPDTTVSSLRGQVALVTGASRGIGLETARQLGRLGISVITAARDLAKAELIANELRSEGSSAIPLKLDVTRKDDREATYAYLAERYGRLDILINNAGVWLETDNAAQRVPNQTSSLSLGLLHQIFEVNFFSVVGLTQTLLPLIHKASSARIVNLSSTMGSLALQADPSYPYYSHKIFGYSASKTALNSFTIHLAQELRETRIKVNSVHPGWVRTDMGGADADLDVAEAAQIVVNFATLPDDGPTGGFYFGNQKVPW
jgi:NAD(P)-dependent dehydrogenase (short-subunit alcohol dehydrogenase family)